MQYSNKTAFTTPIINRVVYLNEQLVYYGRRLPNGKKRKDAAQEQRMTIDIRRAYFMPLLEKAEKLFVYAIRQLKGRDYLNRSIELIDEIKAQSYLIMVLRGWSNKVCADLHMICDDIAEQLHAIAAANKPESSSPRTRMSEK